MLNQLRAGDTVVVWKLDRLARSTRALRCEAAMIERAPAVDLSQRNWPMRASLAILGVIALFCLIGPLVSGHPYDQVYRDYVLVRPSPFAHPDAHETHEARCLPRKCVLVGRFISESRIAAAARRDNRAATPRQPLATTAICSATTTTAVTASRPAVGPARGLSGSASTGRSPRPTRRP